VASVSPKRVHVFISYAHADQEIAKALRQELIEVNRERVDCFMDSESIPKGEKFEPIISKQIRRADWLIVVFTGEQSEYCGFEIGMFVQMRTGSRKKNSKLVCLHDTHEIPTLFRSHQTVRVDDPVPNMGRPEEDFYLDSSVARLLGEFYEYEDLYPRTAEAERQRQFLLKQTKTITEAFRLARGSDLKEETSVQQRLEIRVKKFEQPPREIPLDAELSGTNGVFAIFGLTLPQDARLTWGQFKQHLTNLYRGAIPLWLRRIERDVLYAAEYRSPTSAEATVQGEKGVIYRPLLARHELYYDGSRKFYILFIESLPSKFLGKQNTSTLLAGLVLASRFRFAYFEEWDRMFTSKFGESLSDSEFWSNCTQLLYDLERMEHEATEFGLLDPNELVAALGEANRATTEAFLRIWREERTKLFSGLLIPDGNRGSLETRHSTKEIVLGFFRAMQSTNAKFLDIASAVYRSELVADLRVDQTLNGDVRRPSEGSSKSDDSMEKKE